MTSRHEQYLYQSLDSPATIVIARGRNAALDDPPRLREHHGARGPEGIPHLNRIVLGGQIRLMLGVRI